MADGRLIAIGDVHGCGHALDALIDSIRPTADDTLVFIGDMVDQGPETREVLERIIELKSRCEVVLIEGNHEELMFKARESQAAFLYWEHCGGALTIDSYHFGGKLSDVLATHWELLAECLPYYETDEFIFTHANYLPDEPMDLQPGYELRWAVLEPKKVRPHLSEKTVFVGHTEQRDGEVLDLGFVVCIDTSCWRYGWLTAIDVRTRETWQASKWGMLRDPGETTHRDKLMKLIATSRGTRRPVRADS
jgi:serine/threonine protein phosphatase 1